ncbi:MAG: hypothetical protein H6806_11570 [Planctomycetes bacterium]|nr:hypothetical protein [Planctomycetota bacterium]MCB9830382.1 hypothetical protein [Planctomycetota bacterium]MCB9901373.1 hypothetical protein [Planctomycetota bacterium]
MASADDGWTRVFDGALEAARDFRAVAGEVSAPWLPHAFRWRGGEHQVASCEPLGRRTGRSFESAGETYVRGHRVHVTTRHGLELVLEGLRGGRGPGGRWRVVEAREPGAAGGATDPA